MAEIFRHWVAVMEKPRAQLGPDRVRLIRAALKVATAAECKLAITGCSRSDFHMGKSERGATVYNDLSLILRNRGKIEGFMELAPQIAGGVNVEGLSPAAFNDLIGRHKRNVLGAYDLAGSVEAQRKGDESEQWLGDHGIRVVRAPDARPTFEDASESQG